METRPPPSKRRYVVLAGSIFFLCSALLAEVFVPAFQRYDLLPSPVIDLALFKPAAPRPPERSLARRLREDADVRLLTGDYENALARLDQAAQLDPAGDQSNWARSIRLDALTHLGEAPDDGKPSQPNPSPEASKSHE